MDNFLESLGHCNGFKFTKQHRLLVAADFKSVFDQVNFKIHQPNLLCFVSIRQPQTSLQRLESRLGIAITKKKVKRAHDRNRIKRLARECFRLNQHQLLVPVDMVLTVKQSPIQLSNLEVTDQIQKTLTLINRKLQSHANSTT